MANDIVVSLRHSEYRAIVAGMEYRCAVGKSGIASDKREGDGKTPMGTFPLREVLVRPDKIDQLFLPKIFEDSLPMYEIKPYDGWCDEPLNPYYNRHVDLRSFDIAISHENLYRDDDLYDLIIVVGYNDSPVVPQKGSAIFIHVARPEYSGTAGCVAFSHDDLLDIVSKLSVDSKLIVQEISEEWSWY